MRRGCSWLALAAAAGCSPAPPPIPGSAGAWPAEETGGKPWFEEVSEERGLVFRYESGHEGAYLFPEIIGGGAALVDLDSDGDLDAYCVQGGRVGGDPAGRPGNQLFANDGNGHFADRSAKSGAEDRGYGMGCAAGDADGDGRVDLYVTNLDTNALLRNAGRLRFLDDTSRSGTGDAGWSTSAAFLDHDADGDLDLFATNYVYWSEADEIACEVGADGPDYCSPKSYGLPAPDTLYQNLGDGRFEDISASAGIRTAFGNGLGVVCADLDRDGRVDVFVANDGLDNQLWRNLGDGTFRDEALVRGVAVDQDGAPKAGMGVALADLDEDGDHDVLVVNFGKESDSLYRNDGDYFSDRTPALGLAAASRAFTRFGCGFADFDNDGRLDLFEVAGRVIRPESIGPGDPYAERNVLLRGTDSGFVEVRPWGGTIPTLVATSRAAAFGDVDGDGGVDVLVINRDAPSHLLRSVTRGGHWIRLEVVETSGRAALGARVEIAAGARRQVREVHSAYSYCAANDPTLHLGLGAATRVDTVHVRWVDGTSDSFGPFEVDRTVRLHRGQSR